MIAVLVGAHGLFLLAVALLEQLSSHHGRHFFSTIVVDIPLVIGLSLIYLSGLLRRCKYNAWLIAILAYVFYLGLGLLPLIENLRNDHLTLLSVVGSLILPLAVLGLLVVFRDDFVVRSDRQGFRSAFRFSITVVVVAMIYGSVGFTLFDKSDFHQEISLGTAAHYTIDQFDLTTNHPVRPYTKRARVFVDSLSFVSTAAIVYVVIALFQPLRLKLSDQSGNRQKLQSLLYKYGGASEDYFKVWPHDKQYFFDSSERSGLAYHVWHGVALCLGDPVGDRRSYGKLFDNFSEVCYQNDWLPAAVHVEERHRKLYESRGFMLQKLGQEAVVDLGHFNGEVARNKYFRQIGNKFTKQGYSAELLQPPHHQAVIQRLKAISDDWLDRGGHVERGFAMGSFGQEYMQTCPIMIVSDAAGTIQAFANQLPADFDNQEATYDLLRTANGALGNSADYLVMRFAAILQQNGYARLNLGLCPLTGLDETAEDERTGLIHSLLQFTYANGDRLYSFSGLYRFKAKYEPEWRDRYVAYQGGVRGFSRTMTALMRTMRIKS